MYGFFTCGVEQILFQFLVQSCVCPSVFGNLHVANPCQREQFVGAVVAIEAPHVFVAFGEVERFHQPVFLIFAVVGEVSVQYGFALAFHGFGEGEFRLGFVLVEMAFFGQYLCLGVFVHHPRLGVDSDVCAAFQTGYLEFAGRYLYGYDGIVEHGHYAYAGHKVEAEGCLGFVVDVTHICVDGVEAEICKVVLYADDISQVVHPKVQGAASG